MKRRVVKLGGSLLGDEAIAGRLAGWLVQQTGTRNIIICGGGTLVDALRELCRVHAIDDTTAHWSAIRLMDECTRLLADRVGRIPLADSVEEIPAAGDCFLLVYELFRSKSRLPCSWDVTSDSLAAELATLVGADELWLLKSSPPPGAGPDEWARQGWVDRTFPVAAAALGKVIALNFREIG